MDRGRIPRDAFVGFDEDTNDEPPFFPDDFDVHFEHSTEHSEEPPEFLTEAPVREKYDEYQSVAPFKRPPQPSANRYDPRNTKRDGHHSRRDVPLGMTRTEMSYDYDYTNPKQARDFQPERREVNSKVQNVHTVSYKHVETTKRARNRSPPCDSFVESRPAKMPSLSAGTRENPREKDKYLSSARTGQPQYGTRSTANPNKQSTKEDQHLTSKFEQPEKGIPPSDEVIILTEALEKSKAVLKRLENESAKNEHQLAQINQTNENLQKQIIDLDKEKNASTTEAHNQFCIARKVLKMQNQFHENVELLAGYLNNKNKIKETAASACSTSSLTKLQETLNFWRKSRDEVKTTTKSYHELHKKLNKSVEETSIDVMESNLKRLSLDLNKNLVLVHEKRIQYEMTIEKTQEDIMRMNAEINRLKAITKAHHDHQKAKLIDFFKLAKFQIEFARKQKDLLKNQALKQIARQKEIINSFSNEIRDVVAKLEFSKATNRDLERDVNAAKSKLEELDEEYHSINSEFEKMEKLGTSRGQANSMIQPVMLEIEMKFEKLLELIVEKRQYETKKLLLVEKLKRARHDVDENKREQAELQDRLMKITQIKKTVVELVSIVKKTQQEKELGIRVAKENAEALVERRRELLEQLDARNDSMMREMKAQVSTLSTLSRIKGEEEIRRDMKQRELSSKEKEVLGKLFEIADLELETERINKENQYLDDMCRTQREKLVKVKCEKERAESGIRMIKKFVRDRLYTTVQEINKATKDVQKRKEIEELALKELEEALIEKKRKLKELIKSKNRSLK